MADVDRLDHLEERLQQALNEVERLTSIEAIRECVYRVCRGTDRIDADILRTAFHADAVVHFGKIYDGPVSGWIDAAIKHQASQAQRQHLVGNILIRIEGDEAFVESYELDRHKTPMHGEVLDLVLAARTLDRFERRDGEWRIAERTKIMDWGRIITAIDGPYINSPMMRGGDDRSDGSYLLLP
jgi:hypothetical protein